jgi:hypothetical protein
MNTTPAGRDNISGRFALGNRYGKGNPQARRMAEIRQALLDAAAPEKAAEVIRKMGDMAVDGDTTAARIYLEYTAGKPIQALELSGPDGEPLAVDWSRLTTVILGAVGDDPKARASIARALRGLTHDAGDAEQPGPDVGPESLDGGPGP